ncbi:MAG TPA: S-layer homology domain-containing protein [Symbiobacteriaceae bacterium]|nr:S-layer homology domain-containing protein [Symbiobacteriaceae bacterium]
MRRRLLGLSLAVTLAASAIPGAPAGAAAPLMQPLSLTASVRALQNYDIIDKVPESELRLDQTVTRAEMAKVLGAALKLQQAAGSNINAVPFPDMKGHWATGWVTVARERGLFLGRDDGLFHPQDPVTYAEVLTVLLRLTGRGPHAAFNWPWGAISLAAEFGMIPADMDLAGHMLEPATRGNVFRLTAISAGRLPLSGSGDTLLQSLGDRTAPMLELIRVPTVTGDWRPTLTGRAVDAVTVQINGAYAEINPDGTFSLPVPLSKGQNQVTFLAIDGAGNRAERTANILMQTVARAEFAPALIETSWGHPFKPTVLRIAADGTSVVADEISWAYDPGALSYDSKMGTFTAKRAGEFTLRASVEGVDAVAKVISAGEPAQIQVTTQYPTVVAGGAPVPVTVRVLDSVGRLVTGGNEQVSLNVYPSNGGAFDMPMVTVVRGTGTAYLSPGQLSGGLGIQASLSGAGTKILSPVVVVNVEPRRFAGIQLSTSPPNTRPVPGQSISIIATAVDQVGIPLAVREDVPVSLTVTDRSILSLTRGTALIKAGTSSSDLSESNGAAITTGTAGTVSITGTRGAMAATPAIFRAVAGGPLASLDVKVVREAAPADKLSATLVSVTRRDQVGNVVAGDNTPVVLYSANNAANVSLVSDSGGVALFAIRSGMGGRVDLAAGLPGRPEMNSKPVTVAFAQTMASAKPTIRTTSRTVTAGGTFSAYIALENSQGQLLANPGPTLKFLLESPGTTMTATELTIPTGATTSGLTVVNVPTSANLVSLGGRMVGGDAFLPSVISVMPLPPVLPAPVPTGLNLVATPAQTGRPPVAGEDVKFRIAARNGTTLQTGSQAFGLKVLVGGQEWTTPMQSLTIKAGPRSLIPGEVIRTTAGEAELWVKYTGTGTIELQPVPAPAVVSTSTTQVSDHFGVLGPAASTTEYRTTGGTVTFKPGPIHHMDVQVGSNLGDPFAGFIKAAKGRFATVRIAPADLYGNPTGDNCLATLTQVRSSPPGALVIRQAVADVVEHSQTVATNGYAEFIVAATTDSEATSEWSPMIICGSTPLTTTKNIVVNATVHSAPTPIVEFVGGSSANVLKLSDPYLNIRIARMTGGPATAELLVYEGNLLLGRFGPVAGASPFADERTIRLPTSLFYGRTRMVTLKVRIHSGADVSEESGAVYFYFNATQ